MMVDAEVKKLHLGCGDIILPDFINCDLFNPKADLKCDVAKLPFEDNSIDEIYASHIIEHFHFYEAMDVLKEWCRVLKPGGKVMIETPDMYASCMKFISADARGRSNLYGHFFAQPWLPGQIHKFLFTEEQLAYHFSVCGYEKMQRVPAKRYIGCEDQNLGMIAFKKCVPEEKSGALHNTQILSFEIGKDCNMSKIHDKCPNSKMIRTEQSLTDEIIVNAVVDAYENLGFEGYISWSFYNEPMLHYERMFNLMERIRSKVLKSRFLLWTNGTVLVEDSRMKLFERIYVTNYNSVPMEKLRTYFGANVISIASRRDEKGIPTLDDRLNHYGEANKNGCTLPFDNLVISYTGEAYICCTDWQNEVKLGNIFESTLGEIDKKRVEILKKISGKKMSDDAPAACLGCAFKWTTCGFDDRIRERALAQVAKWEGER
jgi:radical SAM protein with 4Fe4S-binding SPASM domain